MDYAYTAYTEDKKLIRGKVSATNEEAAVSVLDYAGYQVISLKPVVRLFDMKKLAIRLSRVNPREIMMFSRQLALLLESGTDIVSSLQLLQSQMTNRKLKGVLGEVVADVRGGSSLSAALMKHPQVFPPVYSRAIVAGEQGGNLELVLRQMVDYIEKRTTTEKKVKNALTYPIITIVVAIVVIGILVTFVLPTFAELYASFEVELPLATSILISITNWFSDYGLYLFLAIVLVAGSVFAYVRTPTGKSWWDRLLLRLPRIGYILLLTEASRFCRTVAMLFRIGLPLVDIMTLAIQSSNNKAMVEALTGVKQEAIRGEGLSRPMARRKFFLPLMVQMAAVGEETGQLDNTLTTVAEAYEIEADDRISTTVGLIQPTMVIVIGVIVAFIVLSLVLAMYSIYGQVGF